MHKIGIYCQSELYPAVILQVSSRSILCRVQSDHMDIGKIFVAKNSSVHPHIVRATQDIFPEDRDQNRIHHVPHVLADHPAVIETLMHKLSLGYPPPDTKTCLERCTLGS